MLFDTIRDVWADQQDSAGARDVTGARPGAGYWRGGGASDGRSEDALAPNKLPMFRRIGNNGSHTDGERLASASSDQYPGL